MSATRLKQLASAIGGARPMLPPDHEGQETIEVSVPASTAAALYERVRTTLEYQEEHLLRRNAVARILRRYLGTDTPLQDMAALLLQELVWAKYLPNKQIPLSFIDQLVPIFLKYGPLFDAAQHHPTPDKAFAWVLDVMSTEIEYAIVSHDRHELMVIYLYEQMKERSVWDVNLEVTQEDKDVRLFIACHMALLKSNLAMLRYRTFVLYYPDWPGAVDTHRLMEIARDLGTVIKTVDDQIDHSITQKLYQKVRRPAAVMRVLQDVIEEDPVKFNQMVDQGADALDRAVWKRLKEVTKLFHKRIRATAVRAVLFLFITKMFLALILEVPYDLIFHGEIFYTPLLVNIFFPPILLAIISMTIVIPQRKNADDYREAIRAMMLGITTELLTVKMNAPRRGAWTRALWMAYGTTFVLVFGVIISFLHQMHFNAFSILLFLFFLSLVAFFGIRIRHSTRDLVLSKHRRGILGSLFDLFLLPIVYAGQWLSVKVAKINVFIYFFDFIIESPYKVAIRFVEEWFAFVREKREEIA